MYIAWHAWEALVGREQNITPTLAPAYDIPIDGEAILIDENIVLQ